MRTINVTHNFSKDTADFDTDFRFGVRANGTFLSWIDDFHSNFSITELSFENLADSASPDAITIPGKFLPNDCSGKWTECKL
jgi:hypothetical protein